MASQIAIQGDLTNIDKSGHIAIAIKKYKYEKKIVVFILSVLFQYHSSRMEIKR